MIIRSHGYTIQQLIDEYNEGTLMRNSLLTQLTREELPNISKIDEIIELHKLRYFELLDILFGCSITGKPIKLSEHLIGTYGSSTGKCPIFTFELL